MPSVPSWILVEDYDFSTPLQVVNAALALLAVVFVALVARRVATAPAGARRMLWPLGVAALFAAAQFALGRAARLFDWTGLGVVDTLDQLAGVTVPLALAAGVLTSRRRRRRVGDLVVELGRAGPGHVREALAEAVGDPSLELLLWLPDRGVWVTTDGRTGSLPDDPSRAVTYVGDELAAVVHHPDLVDQRDVIAMAGSAARLALENERLQAELRARLVALRESRARIVRAGDDERRRLERDLHDGAQQRLLASARLADAERALGGEPYASALLDRRRGRAAMAPEELRELARGIHPAVLTDRGWRRSAHARRARAGPCRGQRRRARACRRGRDGGLLRRRGGDREHRQVRTGLAGGVTVDRRGARPSSRCATTALAGR